MDKAPPRLGCGSLDLLPQEVLIEILALLPDVNSLANIALTCRSLYDTATNAGYNLGMKILARHLSPAVLDLAFLVHDACRPDGWVEEWIRISGELPAGSHLYDMKEQLLEKMPSIPQHLTFEDALALGRFHCIVEQLSQRFVNDTLCKESQLLLKRPVSSREHDRILSAMYRTEIFSIFRRLKLPKDPIRMVFCRLFAMRYHSFENEQMACILDWTTPVIRGGMCLRSSCCCSYSLVFLRYDELSLLYQHYDTWEKHTRHGQCLGTSR
jgi:hypothetical protein